MSVRWITISTAVLISAIGLAAHRGPKTATAQPVITKLVGRNSTITITSSGNGPRYSVTTLDGKTILANVTIDELREKDRDSYQQVNGTITYAGIEANE